ncbi:hypothetical protein J7I94_19425 [Streptomyces sp. ISL-12]|uniref:hypothetical protein n=1 Tax=Streptomyces sp. ISL-12 TaxID=2819177 RepID=UPI001BEB312F|nr:hypothetical protein [Streptomyces sp. ISL-12]MBT2412705.1 hypothetical protein [Streptomyces sp. ISL-12]
MTVEQFPLIHVNQTLNDLPTVKYVGCMQCIELAQITDGVNPVEWAKAHTVRQPWHTTFRITSTVDFSVTRDMRLPVDPVAP